MKFDPLQHRVIDDLSVSVTNRHQSSGRRTAGRNLKQQYQKTFPNQSWWSGDLNGNKNDNKTVLWQAAAANGATLGWALRVAGTTVDDVDLRAAPEVGWALRIAASAPVNLIDGLLADGWTLAELTSQLYHLPDGRFLDAARRLRELHKAAPGTGGPDGSLLWYALAAVLAAGPAGLTDLQALRWLQALTMNVPSKDIPRIVLADSLAEEAPEMLREWAAAAGPDGWAWTAAGYTPDETRVLRALPETHPGRPRPDQLAVMAALRER